MMVDVRSDDLRWQSVVWAFAVSSLRACQPSSRRMAAVVDVKPESLMSISMRSFLGYRAYEEATVLSKAADTSDLPYTN